MKISIITVCKNSQNHIEKSIQSVISQTYKNIEYIIIDGASDDKTCEIINKYKNHIHAFKSEPDHSLYEAMNKGLRLASGDFLYFLNSDDYIFDERVISDVVNFITKNPKSEFIYGNCQTRSPLGILSVYEPVEPKKILDEMLILGDFPIQAASFFKAELFTRFGNFSENYRIASDYEWYTRILNAQNVYLFYYPRIISSFYRGGLSSDFRKVFPEVWAIQDKALVYQTDYWKKQRVIKLQELIIKTEQLTKEANLLAANRQNIINVISIFNQSFNRIYQSNKFNLNNRNN
ncbi:glycosyl transferase [Synechococcus sp. PCC 7502]|uniref:glycosyltransferase family 2 protein n=1 Tax=Synechococcus sp. PCC 7502 TaxID=1173263 RepID=UPI00029F924A|nr:glycosyltransferase family 2 protein [Synechococcus sp. PCC 7502]AFY73437.1 glycosyl transferase [Synechococcus sp. PCC 7502]